MNSLEKGKKYDGARCVVWELRISSKIMIAVDKSDLAALSLLYYKQVIDMESNSKHLNPHGLHIWVRQDMDGVRWVDEAIVFS